MKLLIHLVTLIPILSNLLLGEYNPLKQEPQRETWATSEQNYSATQKKTLPVVTLNTYWFINPENTTGKLGDPPKSQEEKQIRAKNLAQLILTGSHNIPPWIIALQEIGTEEDLQDISQAIKSLSGEQFIPLFVKGKDTFTKQNTGLLLNPKFGWKIRGQANRPSDLEKEISKHTSLTLEKGGKTLTVTTVHLRVPKNPEATTTQTNQVRALLRHATTQLSRSPNLIILGDFNIPTPPGKQGVLNILLDNTNMTDTSISLPREDQKTHQKINRMLDRILISSAILNGNNGLQQTGKLTVLFHNLDPKTATDHFPVTLFLRETLE